MKRGKTRMVGCIFLILCLGVLFSGPVWAKTLTYADHDPPSGLRVNSVKLLIQEIEKQTQGRLTVKPFFGGAMGKASEALKLVADGSVDMAFVFPDFFPKQLMAHNIFKLFPQGPGKWENIRWVYEECYRTIPAFANELAKEDQKTFYITSALPGAMCATYPLTSIDGLKGKKWRASSRWHLAYFKALGAVPVSVPWADCYMSLQTGVIDGVLTDYDGMHDTKLDEAAPNIFIGPEVWFGTPFLHTINLKTWSGLSKEDQQGLVRAADKISTEHFGKAHEEEYHTVMNAQKKAGAKVVFWKKSDLEAWNNNPAIPEVRKIWIKEAKESGIADAEAVMEKVKAIVEAAIKKESK